MGDLITMPVHTSGSVDDYFVIEGFFLSTRCADAFKALDRASKESVSLWKLRESLPVNSDAVRRFLNRLALIGDMDPPLCSMLSYGVDASGVGFAIFPALLGRPFGERGVDKLENERLFGSAVRKIAALHSRDILCGDICGASFWIDRVGEPSFIGAMGAVDIEMTSPAELPPIETLHYVSPEQRDRGLLIAPTDVFALGVLGYQMFTGHFPYGEQPQVPGQELDISQVALPTSFGPQVPGWADEVLMKCLHPDPARRYADAEILFKGIAQARQRQSEQQAPVSVQREEVETNKAVAATHAPLQMGKARLTQPAEESVPLQKRGSLGLTLGLVVILVAVVVVGLVVTRPSLQPVRDDTLARGLQKAMEGIEDPAIKEAAGEISNPDVALAAKAQKIEQVAGSDDPLSHELLVKIALDAPTRPERELAEKAILTRATRLGLKRSAEQVRQWLRASAKGEHPPGYAPILRSLDTTLPEERHENMLKEAYPTNPKIVLRLTAALAFDTGKIKEYQPVLAQLISDMNRDETLQGRSIPALVLASNELAPVFAEEALQAIEQLPNEDLLWVLGIVAERGDASLHTVAMLATERGIFSPLRRTYVDLIIKRDNLPRDMVVTLIKAAAGVLRKEDVVVIGRWLDAQVEGLLFTICADDTNPQATLEAFDILAGKNVAQPAIRNIIEWVRSSHWAERAQFAVAIGTLGVLDKVSPAQVEKVVDAFGKYLGDSRILDSLIELKNPLIFKGILLKYGKYVDAPMLLRFMDYPDKEVRLIVVERAASYSKDVVVMKMAIDYYEKETDPDVRKLYLKGFWSIRDREERNRK